MEQKEIAEMVKACFRKPNEEEEPKSMNCTELLQIIPKDYPSVILDRSTRISLGLAM